MCETSDGITELRTDGQGNKQSTNRHRKEKEKRKTENKAGAQKVVRSGRERYTARGDEDTVTVLVLVRKGRNVRVRAQNTA